MFTYFLRYLRNISTVMEDAETTSFEEILDKQKTFWIPWAERRVHWASNEPNIFIWLKKFILRDTTELDSAKADLLDQQNLLTNIEDSEEVLRNRYDYHRLKTHSNRLSFIDFPSDLIPDEYLCVISMDIMDKPGKLLKTNDHFDFESINKIFIDEAFPRHPITREPINIDDFKVDEALKAEIEDWVRLIMTLHRYEKERLNLEGREMNRRAYERLAGVIRDHMHPPAPVVVVAPNEPPAPAPAAPSSFGMFGRRSRNARHARSASAPVNDPDFKEEARSSTPRPGQM